MEIPKLYYQHALELILNIYLNDKEWTQAILPIKSGGLSIRKIKDLTLPTFLASANGSRNLVIHILNTSTDKMYLHNLEDLKLTGTS